MTSSDNAVGYKVLANSSYCLKNTEHYISYNIKETGFHFSVNKEVMYSVEKVASAIQYLVKSQFGRSLSDLDFYIAHTGGRRILDEMTKHFQIEDQDIIFSRQSLSQAGNISSVVVFDVLNRIFENRKNISGEKGILLAFGPGFTAEFNVGVWSE